MTPRRTRSSSGESAAPARQRKHPSCTDCAHAGLHCAGERPPGGSSQRSARSRLAVAAAATDGGRRDLAGVHEGGAALPGPVHPDAQVDAAGRLTSKASPVSWRSRSATVSGRAQASTGKVPARAACMAARVAAWWSGWPVMPVSSKPAGRLRHGAQPAVTWPDSSPGGTSRDDVGVIEAGHGDDPELGGGLAEFPGACPRARRGSRSGWKPRRGEAQHMHRSAAHGEAVRYRAEPEGLVVGVTTTTSAAARPAAAARAGAWPLGHDGPHPARPSPACHQRVRSGVRSSARPGTPGRPSGQWDDTEERENQAAGPADGDAAPIRARPPAPARIVPPLRSELDHSHHTS